MAHHGSFARAVVALAAAAFGLLGPVLSADAAQGPTCPSTLDSQPLAVHVPFSGTPRPVAGADGEIVATSLLCAYGEGLRPAAEVLVSWSEADDCGRVETRAAPEVDASAVNQTATALAEVVGGPCAGDDNEGFNVLPWAVLAAAGAAVAVRHRRRHPTVEREPVG